MKLETIGRFPDFWYQPDSFPNGGYGHSKNMWKSCIQGMDKNAGLVDLSFQLKNSPSV